jgi:hypothetical protein
VAFAHVLTEARAGHDAIRAHTDAIRHHYHTQVSASNSQSDWRIALHRSLNERAAHLGLQEMDLEVREAALAEELERGLRRPDGRDMPAELDEASAWVHRVANDRATKAECLSRQLAWVTRVLIDLGLPPIEDIPWLS